MVYQMKGVVLDTEVRIVGEPRMSDFGKVAVLWAARRPSARSR